MPHVINKGNVDDIRNSLKLGENKLTIRDLRNDLDDEKNLPEHKRSSVIRLLVAAIERKLKLSGAKFKPGTCRVCLCTQNHACPDPETGTCWWVQEDLCSACASPEQRKRVKLGSDTSKSIQKTLKSLNAFTSAFKNNFNTE